MLVHLAVCPQAWDIGFCLDSTLLLNALSAVDLESTFVILPLATYTMSLVRIQLMVKDVVSYWESLSKIGEPITWTYLQNIEVKSFIPNFHDLLISLTSAGI